MASEPAPAVADAGPAPGNPDLGLAFLEATSDAPSGPPAESAPPQSPETPAPVAEPFEIGGQRYESREAADRALRAELTRARTSQSNEAKLRNELQTLRARAEEAIGIAKSWADWHAGQRQGQPQQPQPQGDDKPWYHGLDWGLAQELAEEKGIGTALFYLAEQMDGHYSKRFEELRKSVSEPYEQDRQSQAIYQQTMDAFTGVSWEKDSADQLLFPELHDNAKAADIVRIWTEIPNAHALGRDAIELAVMRYRRVNGPPTPSTPPAPAASGASQELLRAQAARAAASAETVSGNGTPRPAVPGQASGFRQLIAGSAQRAKAGDLDLGFVVSE